MTCLQLVENLIQGTDELTQDKIACVCQEMPDGTKKIFNLVDSSIFGYCIINGEKVPFHMIQIEPIETSIQDIRFEQN